MRAGRYIPLIKPGVDQQPVEAARLGAAVAAVEQPVAALQDLFCSANDGSSGTPAASSTTSGR